MGIPISLLLVLSLATAVALELSCKSTECPHPSHGRKSAASTTAPQYIVRFNSYLKESQHHSMLASHLAGEGVIWSWLTRHNQAAAHPTDFGLIKMGSLNEPTPTSKQPSDATQSCSCPFDLLATDDRQTSTSPSTTALFAMVQALPFVRDIHADRRYTGKLKWEPGER
jgi:hypothetical protein